MWPEPLVRLPDVVCFSLAEAGRILLAVDMAVLHAPPGGRAAMIARRAQILLTGRLWPELGRIIGEEE